MIQQQQQKFYKPSLQYAKHFIKNSALQLKSTVVDTMLMRPFAGGATEKRIYDSSSEGTQAWALGADRAIGGGSTAYLKTTDAGKLRFQGNISLALKPGSDALYSGFAAMRTRAFLPNHMFAGRYYDCTQWPFIVLRMKGDHRTYSFNFKTAWSVSGDLYTVQFRFLRPYEWEDVILPFQYFIRANCGREYMKQYPPSMDKIQTFGFLLSDNLPGPYQLDLDYIKVTNFDQQYANVDFSQLLKADASDDGKEDVIGTDTESEQLKQQFHFLTKNLVNKRKLRDDWHGSLDNMYGFGMDIGGGGPIETPQMHAQRQITRTRIFNSDWVVKVKPRNSTSNQSKKSSTLLG